MQNRLRDVPQKQLPWNQITSDYMDKKFEKLLKFYDYSVPKGLIAKKPASPRDSARLLVYERKGGKIFFDKFINLTKYLPKDSVLVLNDTRVLPARLLVKKEILRQGSGQAGGGLARILYIGTPSVADPRSAEGFGEARAMEGKKGKLLKFLSDRDLRIGSKISLVKSKFYFKVEQKEGSFYFLKPSFNINKTFEVLEKYGLTPIPPYIKNISLSEKELRKEYQTIFALKKGSVAAPTASLHFTKRLLNRIKKSGIKIVYITLHVGLGTFAPLTEENIKTSKLHPEYYEIDRKSAEILNNAKKSGKLIIAAGTTVVRALESAVSRKSAFINESRLSVLKKLRGETDIFIKEGDKFNFVDGIITNFHVPRSSLMMLVAAFIGRKKLLGIYKKAIQKRFRFFSFGDGMIIV